MKMDKEICRICLAGNIRMHSIVNLDLQKVYEKLSDQLATGAKPLFACYICYARLKTCQNLMIKCHQSEELLTQIMNNNQGDYQLLAGQQSNFNTLVTSPVQQTSMSDETHVAVKDELDFDDEVVIKFEMCEDPLEGASHSSMDWSKSHTGTPGPGISDVCNIKVKKESLDDSEYKEVPIEFDKREVAPAAILSTAEEDTIESYKPNIYTVEIHVTDDLKDRDLPVEEGPYKCDVCHNTYKGQKYFKRHLRVHYAEKRYQCYDCNKVFLTKSNLDQHVRKHTGDKPYKCDKCESSFSYRSALKGHMNTHFTNKPYKCEVCQRTFVKKSDLVKHIRIHTGEKPFKCELLSCQKSFSDQSSYKKHIRVHTGEKPYKCHICNSSFGLSDTLKKHIRVHTGEKPYKCNICESSFTQIGTLKIHLEVHNRTKPIEKLFTCHICNVKFSRKTHLNNHIRIHTGEKKYKCKMCPVSFNTKSSLNSHTLTHDEEKAFKCNSCARGFETKSILDKHTCTEIKVETPAEKVSN